MMINWQIDSDGITCIIDKQEVGEMHWIENLDAQTLDIVHTQVISKYRGQGIAQQLLEQAILYAKKHHLKIIPSCSYVKYIFEQNPNKYQKLIAEDYA